MTTESQADVVREARGTLATHSVSAFNGNMDRHNIRPLVESLCDEVVRLREIEAQWNDAVKAGLIITE